MKSSSDLFRIVALGVAGLIGLLRAETATEFTTTASGLQYVVTVHGAGPSPQPGQVIVAQYTGLLPDGTVFDSTRETNTPFAFTLGRKQVIKGWDEAFALLHVGDQATLIVPPGLAYGEKQVGKIPANSTLRFDVELVALKDRALADLLQDTIDGAGLAAAQAKFAEARAAKFDGLYVDQAQLNGLGYHYLGKAGQLPVALAVLQWNVELFPASGNTYDSLGEACVKNGDRAAAIRNYAKALELDSKNKNAERMLDEIKATPDAPGALTEMQARMQVDDALEAAFDAAEAHGYDVPALKAKVTAFLDKYPADPGAGGLMGNYFYYVESADLQLAKAEWAAFANHPNEKVRELAAQKMQLAELIKAPLELKFTAADGRAVDVAALRGKVVLVDFWATWCGPCVQEIPNVVAVYGQYHPQGFEVVGISFDQAPDAAKPAKRQKTAEQVLAFTREKGMPWPQYYDGTYWQNPYGKKYGIRGIPAMFLLDKNGMVVSTNARGPKLEAEVKRLLQL
jgi:FKBP-type peptidyl-prolyl cis-trans isomerase 2